jgi:cyclophilin family peptidyl-prolyl cis-trans isomerase
LAYNAAFRKVRPGRVVPAARLPALHGDPRVKQATIQTDQGNMTLRFFPDVAPKHVENFLTLAEKGFYDGLAFHRIMKGFMIQGGCPKGDGTGSGPSRLPAEFSDRPHKEGTLSMARAQDPNSASCQFFICLDRCDFLDGQYTVFGELTDDASRQTLQKIGNTPVRDSGHGESSSPVNPVKINKVTVEEVE